MDKIKYIKFYWILLIIALTGITVSLIYILNLDISVLKIFFDSINAIKDIIEFFLKFLYYITHNFWQKIGTHLGGNDQLISTINKVNISEFNLTFIFLLSITIIFVIFIFRSKFISFLNWIFDRSCYSIIKTLQILIRPIPLIPWAGHLYRWLLSSWRRPILDLIIIITVIAVILHFIYPLDPAGLDDKLGKFNSSEQVLLKVGELPEEVSENEEKFKNAFSNYIVFNKVLSNDTIMEKMFPDGDNKIYDEFKTKLSVEEYFKKALNNTEIITNFYELINCTIKKESNKCMNVCKDIYCQNDADCICDKIINKDIYFLDKTKFIIHISKNESNRVKTLDYMYKNKIQDVIKNVSENKKLRRTALLQLTSNDPDYKRQVIKDLHDNSTLKNESLTTIFKDIDCMKIVSAIVAEDKGLQKELFIISFSPRNRLIALLWNFWAQMLIIWLIFEILLWGRRLSRSLAVNDFIDESVEIAKTSEKPPAEGLGPQLVAKLNWIYSLYSQVDERRPLSTVAITEMPASAAIKAEEAVNILGSGEILDASTKLSLGLLSIPQKLINDLAGFIFKRPAINGTLHKQSVESNEVKFITARMVSKNRSYSWKVGGREDLTEPWEADASDGKTPEMMVDELAYHIFTSLAFGSRMISWRAVRSFSEGLRMYRRSLRNEIDKEINLQNAEKYFLQAISEDQEFAWAYYNLGVVYTEMDELQAAYQAFCNARKINSGVWQIHYALALNRYSRYNNSGEVVKDCKEALNLCPDLDFSDRSRILWLKGLAEKRQIDDDNEDKKKEREKSLKHASVYSLCALAMNYFREDDPRNDRIHANKFLKDLAQCYEANQEHKFIMTIAKSVLPEDAASPTASSSYPNFVDTLHKTKQLNKRTSVIGLLTKDDAELLKDASRKSDQESYYKNMIYELMRDQGSLKTNEINLEALKEHCHLNILQKIDFARKAYIFASKDETSRHCIDKAIVEMEQHLKDYHPKNDIEGLFAAIEFYQLVLCYIKYNYLYCIMRSKKCERCDEIERMILEREFIIKNLKNIINENSKTSISKSLKRFPSIRDQLTIQISQELENLGIEHFLDISLKKILGFGYLEREDYARAKQEFETAMLLEPNDSIIRYNLGVAYVNAASNLYHKDEIIKNTGIGERYLTQSLKLSRSKEDRIRILYWLGVLNYQRRKFGDAVAYFKICLELVKEITTEGFELWPIYLRLGKTYLEQKRYDDCEVEFENILNDKNKAIGKEEQKYGDIFSDRKMNIRKILISAHLGLATSFMEKQTNYEKVMERIESAEKLCPSNDDKKMRAHISASKGWLKCLLVQEFLEGLLKLENLKLENSCKLDDANIENSILSNEENNLIKFNKGEIKSAFLKLGDILDIKIENATIEALGIKNRTAIKGESENGIIRVDSAELNLLQASLNEGGILPLVEASISDLEDSLNKSAEPKTCLHLAQALEIKLGLTSDAKVREAITRQIAARCKLARQLDIMEDYKNDIDALCEKYAEKKDKKEEPKEKVTPTSTISLSIEGSAKGDITSKEDSKEKK